MSSRDDGAETRASAPRVRTYKSWEFVMLCWIQKLEKRLEDGRKR